MKLLILVSLFMLNNSLIACPNINANYSQCTTGDRANDKALGLEHDDLITFSTQKFQTT